MTNESRGEGWKRIDESAREAARKSLFKLNATINAQGASTDQYFGCLNANKTKATLSTGETVDVLVVGDPARCGPLRKIGPKLFLAYGAVRKPYTLDRKAESKAQILTYSDVPFSQGNKYYIRKVKGDVNYEFIAPIIEGVQTYPAKSSQTVFQQLGIPGSGFFLDATKVLVVAYRGCSQFLDGFPHPDINIGGYQITWGVYTIDFVEEDLDREDRPQAHVDLTEINKGKFTVSAGRVGNCPDPDFDNTFVLETNKTEHLIFDYHVNYFPEAEVVVPTTYKHDWTRETNITYVEDSDPGIADQGGPANAGPFPFDFSNERDTIGVLDHYIDEHGQDNFNWITMYNRTNQTYQRKLVEREEYTLSGPNGGKLNASVGAFYMKKTVQYTRGATDVETGLRDINRFYTYTIDRFNDGTLGNIVLANHTLHPVTHIPIIATRLNNCYTLCPAYAPEVLIKDSGLIYGTNESWAWADRIIGTGDATLTYNIIQRTASPIQDLIDPSSTRFIATAYDLQVREAEEYFRPSGFANPFYPHEPIMAGWASPMSFTFSEDDVEGNAFTGPSREQNVLVVVTGLTSEEPVVTVTVVADAQFNMTERAEHHEGVVGYTNYDTANDELRHNWHSYTLATGITEKPTYSVEWNSEHDTIQWDIFNYIPNISPYYPVYPYLPNTTADLVPITETDALGNPVYSGYRTFGYIAFEMDIIRTSFPSHKTKKLSSLNYPGSNFEVPLPISSYTDGTNTIACFAYGANAAVTSPYGAVGGFPDPTFVSSNQIHLTTTEVDLLVDEFITGIPIFTYVPTGGIRSSDDPKEFYVLKYNDEAVNPDPAQGVSVNAIKYDTDKRRWSHSDAVTDDAPGAPPLVNPYTSFFIADFFIDHAVYKDET